MAEAQTILVVDDDRDLNDALRIFLEKHGFRVLQASNGHDGQRLIEQRHPDLVVLDMMMPGRGGYPVLEHLRGKADAPPVVMITANEGSRHQAYAESLGVVDYVRKPFAMERLLEGVEKGLARRAAKGAAAASAEPDRGEAPAGTGGQGKGGRPRDLGREDATQQATS
jgi:DNA-binding response OmpR family regulator